MLLAGDRGRAAGGGRATAPERVRAPITCVASRAGAGDGRGMAGGVLVSPAGGMLSLRMTEAHLLGFYCQCT